MSEVADWMADAIRYRREDKLSTNEIAERVGRSPSRVRRVIAEAQTERAVNGAHSEEDEIKAEMDEIQHREADEVWDGAKAHSEVNAGAEPQGDITAALTNPEDPLEAFKREAGAPVGDMPPADPPADPEATETRLAGTRQMALDFGADELPVGGTIKLKSDKLASGFYGLGDVITGTFTARVVDVLGAERFQRASEEFRIQPQGHVALITEVSLKPVDSDG